MLKRGEHDRDSAINYEQLSVHRNASRWIKALTRFGFIPAAACFTTTHLHDPGRPGLPASSNGFLSHWSLGCLLLLFLVIQ